MSWHTHGGSTLTGCLRWDSSWPRSVEGDEAQAVWGFLAERFGILEETQEGFSLWERGGTYWALAGPSRGVMALASLKVVCVGLPLVRKVGRRLKPTSAALRLLGHRVTRNRVRLKEGEAEELLAGAEIPWTGDASPGYVLLETEAGVLGCGWLLQGRLLSQIPKSEAASFLCRRTSRNTETR